MEETVFYVAPVAEFGLRRDAMTAFPHWPPLSIVNAIWAETGIGDARLAVMHRASGPRAAILGRNADRPAGAAFVAIGNGIAFLHALVVPESHRRQGAGTNILRGAAAWAAENHCDHIALAVSGANFAARSLYASLGMQPVGHYHYRVK